MIYVGVGYRLLMVGETVISTDEFLENGEGEWKTSHYHSDFEYGLHHWPHRRKIEEPVIL